MKNPNHARQFKYKIKRPKNVDSKEVLKWLWANFGKSSVMDLKGGVWFFNMDKDWPYEATYYFKYEQDATLFRMRFE